MSHFALNVSLVQVDTDAAKRNSMLEARCSEQSRRITHYERLERELDCAVLDVGNADEASHDAFAELSAGDLKR